METPQLEFGREYVVGAPTALFRYAGLRESPLPSENKRRCHVFLAAHEPERGEIVVSRREIAEGLLIQEADGTIIDTSGSYLTGYLRANTWGNSRSLFKSELQLFKKMENEQKGAVAA